MAVQLPQKPPTTVNATISDGKQTFMFVLDPESQCENWQADYSVVSVLGTSLADVAWKSSTRTLSFPRVLFVSQGMLTDMDSVIKQLTSWVESGTLLRLNYGSTVINRCFLTKLSIDKSQWKAGKTTRAESSMDFLIAREPVAPTAATKADYTERERGNITTSVLTALKSPAIRKQLNIKTGDLNAATDIAGNVTVTYKSGGVAGTFKVGDLKSQGVIK